MYLNCLDENYVFQSSSIGRFNLSLGVHSTGGHSERVRLGSFGLNIDVDRTHY